MIEEPKKQEGINNPVRTDKMIMDMAKATTESRTVDAQPASELTNRALMVKVANSYINNGSVADFSMFPLHHKMSVFARTPKKFIKTRQVGGITVPYVEGNYAMKVLNFIFNFDVSQEILETKLVETKITTRNGPKTAYLGAVTCKFTFHDPRTYRDIVRTVRASHQMFLSPATTPDDAIKAAITKSWTLAAKSFGLFSDIKDSEHEEAIENKVMNGEIYSPPIKTFDEF